MKAKPATNSQAPDPTRRQSERVRIGYRPDSEATHGAPRASLSARHMALADLRDANVAARRIDWGHVNALCESILVVGLFEPLAIDQDGNVLAGAHRLAALRRLERMHPLAFAAYFPEGRVPVTVTSLSREDLEAASIDVVEMDDSETVRLVLLVEERLRAAGYRRQVGRPKAGEKALGPALSFAVGRSRTTVARILARGLQGNLDRAGHDERALMGVARALERYLEQPTESMPKPMVELREELAGLCARIQAVADEVSESEPQPEQ